MRWSAEVEAGWQGLADGVLTGMKEWRLQHPKASLREIEAALDERLSRVRARMLQDLALASAAADLGAAEPAGTTRVPGVRAGPGGARAARPRIDDLSRSDDPAGAELRGLPRLRRGAFPPWMTSWSCCRAT